MLYPDRNSEGDRAKGYEFLLGLVRTAKLPRLRMEASRGIQQFQPLNEDQRNEILELWKLEKDPTVLKSLNVLLNAPTVPKKK